jgi:4-amino-4-deoxy-L-arabinose transferase-like glycosyltransferase
MIHEEDRKVQEFVHDIETGGLKPLIMRILFFAAVAGLATAYLFVNFRGLDSETAMDQAQIGRQIAAGAGYTTLYVRPLAMWQFLNHREQLPAGLMPDIYNFPLNPVLNAILLRPIKRWWPMEPTDMVYIGDTVIAAAGIFLFFGSVFIMFYLARALFDTRIAWMSAGLVFLTDLLWRFSTSGLPQMLMLFLFSGTLWLLHGAMNAREDKRPGRMLLLLAAAAVLFGLMTLAQPLSLWIFLGFLAFVFAWFNPRAVSGLLVFFVYAAVVAPWLVRNYLVSGNPMGIAIFSILDGTVGSEHAFMSTLQPDLSAFGAVRAKLRGGLLDQFQHLFSYLGYNVAAAAFFFSLLHVFKRRVTNILRWGVMLMWVFAALGMAAFSPRGDVSHNQLHVLFLPIFIAYGMAFLIVLWNRMDLRFAPARIAFISLVFAVSALPLGINLLTSPPGRVAWPPYIAPFIHAVANWMEPDEVICSDMPWATAWYGGRLSLLLPATIPQFITIHDYKYLGGPVNGLYLTPVSGNRPFLSQIAKGDYGAWATFIMRTADLTRFPLQYFTPLPIDNECVFYSNRDRWTPRE